MALQKSIDEYLPSREELGAAREWRFRWPNTADFNFDYYRLLQRTETSGIGRAPVKSLRISIIGAGAAGLVAARELYRSGYQRIDIFEASDRIGGRTYSIVAPNQDTVFELGAMRLPFFPRPGTQNCVLDYYRNLFQIETIPFPNPGSNVCATGIYVNNGFGPAGDYPKPTLDIWKPTEKLPPPGFRAVFNKWSAFATQFKATAQKFYGRDADWATFWHAVVANYWSMNFRDLVRLPAQKNPRRHEMGDFGGFGMSAQESELFYVIGAGDGGWGAFYDISCLFPMRTLLFGYATEHQLIVGRKGSGDDLSNGPPRTLRLKDAIGNPIPRPRYRGVQAFAECLYFEPTGADRPSLHQAGEVRLMLKTPVSSCERLDSGRIRLRASNKKFGDYDAVLLTPATWAVQMSMRFKNFATQANPLLDVRSSLNLSHWISSCKVLFPLKERFWEATPGRGLDPIPQVISTDTFIKDVYGYAVRNDPGVLLASYTWEDDAAKLISDDENELAFKCLEELDDLLIQCRNIRRKISTFVDTEAAQIFHWSKQPTYRGCAKLYRERTWDHDYSLLTYNQELSIKTGIYAAGEAYSVEGGWLEPALRTALDAVIHIIKNTDGHFNGGFDYERNYPKYDISWSPDPTVAK